MLGARRGLSIGTGHQPSASRRDRAEWQHAEWQHAEWQHAETATRGANVCPQADDEHHPRSGDWGV